MYPAYYALRRLNPYRGVAQVVDVGQAIAHSHDGRTWHLRADDGYGWVRPVGVWEAGVGIKAGHPAGQGELIAALETRPALPFPLLDTQELWLLERDTGLPLALLASERATVPAREPASLEWFPFVPTYTGFVSATLAREAAAAPPQAGDTHRERLARMVNDAARPYPMAQWFLRGEDGAGQGGAGLRLPAEWRGRRLAAAEFPELLVRDAGNNRLEHSVIADYHAWLAPLLLPWPRLSEATRERLEGQACDRPAWLARVERLLPTRLNPARIQAALVAARLEAAQDGPDNNWIG